jgi:putative transposase
MPTLALAVLEAFEAGPWDQNYPAIAQTWCRHWDQVIPFFLFSPPIRRIIYTTNTIDALNSKLRRRCAREAISWMMRQQ